MKDNFENNIKESLNGFEVPYDAAAWSAMSKRLDQTMPTSGGSNFKWYLGGAATVAVIVTTALLWPSTDVEKSQRISSNSTEEVKETEKQVHTSKGTSTHTAIKDASSIEAPVKSTTNGTSNPISFDPAPNIFDNPILHGLSPAMQLKPLNFFEKAKIHALSFLLFLLFLTKRYFLHLLEYNKYILY